MQYHLYNSLLSLRSIFHKRVRTIPTKYLSSFQQQDLYKTNSLIFCCFNILKVTNHFFCGNVESGKKNELIILFGQG